MKVKSIRLHPFAGIRDRTFVLKDGINIVLGENEFGKSTLFNAFSAALFIPERPRRGSDDHKAIERCYPRSGGSDIRVTLAFEAEGQGHVLHKTWSNNPKLSITMLQSGPTQRTGDDAENEMARLLRLNRSSWEHMLFIEQSSIHETIGRLRPRIDSLDTVQSFLKDADPFDREGFVRAVRERLKRHESRWDASLQRPEDGRGIDKKWVKDVGSILEAWYEKEELKARHQEILQSEKRIEELNRDIKEIAEEKARLEAFIGQGEPLLTDANRALEIATEKLALETKGNDLKTKHQQWVSAEAVLPDKRQELSNLQAEKTILETELGHASKRSNAADLLRREADIVTLENRILELRSRIEGMRDIPAVVIQEGNASDKAIREARLRLESQQLKAILESDIELTVEASIAGELPRVVTVRPGMQEILESSGSIAIAHGSLRLRVVSGNEDVDQLEATVSLHQQRIRERCVEYGTEDIGGLRAMRDRLLEAQSQLDRLERDLKAQLGGRELSEWKREQAALADIPATRDIPVIQAELYKRTQRIAELGLEIKGMDEKVTRWRSEHGNPGLLMDVVTDLRARWMHLKEEASALAPIPAGYASPNHFIVEMQSRQQRLNQTQEQLSRLRVELGGLQVRLEGQEFSAEELSEKHQSAETRFEHLLMEVKALRRILDVHESLISEKSADPFAKVGSRMVEFLKRLSGGRYVQAEFDKNLPVTIGNADIRLETDILSKGMKGSLALALRLAYAEVYLSDMDGFLMLDDPFTELDPDRRRHAVELLLDMADGKQTILFTCHPEQAGLFPATTSVVYEDAAVGP